MNGRSEGGYVRASRPPSGTGIQSLPGVWGASEQAVRRGTSGVLWPRGATPPTTLSVSSGNASLALSWYAPVANDYSWTGPITNYIVEYTPSGGSPQYVLTNSTSTSYTLTGLTNGTAYTVRVAAVTFTQGAYSSAVTQTPVTETAKIAISGTDAANWSGSGTQINKFVRSGGEIEVSPTIEVSRLRFTATANCVVRVTAIVNDISGECDGGVRIARFNSANGLLSDSISYGGACAPAASMNHSEAMSNGNYIVFRAPYGPTRISSLAVWAE